MKIRILNRSHFTIKDGSPASTLSDFADTRITLPRKKLVFEQQNKEIAKYESEDPIDFEQYDDRLICFLRHGKTKKISFEAFGNEQQLNELKRMIVLRNRIAMHKSPLQKEYSTKVQESLMVDRNRNLNIKGFINLCVIFVCLNYIRLIIESKTEHKYVFIENVSLEVVCVEQKFHRSKDRVFFYSTDRIFGVHFGVPQIGAQV